MKHLLPAALCVYVFMAVALQGQGCPTGQIFLKNDNLPAVPGGPTAVSVIQGLCEGEACGAVFDVSAVGQVVQVDQCAVGYFNAAGAGGIQASVNLKIYDGVSFSGALATLGPLVFDFATAAGASIGVTSHAVNTQDISAFNVIVSSGKLVVVWEMDLNPLGGSCPTGYQTNFGTDNPAFSFSCNTPPQKNLIYILGQGWRDAALANVSGIPLCPIYYNGNWVIRACVHNANPRVVTFFPSANIFAGQFAVANFQADPSEAGMLYIPVISCTPGTTPVPSTTFNLPVLSDLCTSAYFNDPAVHQIFQLTPLPNYFGTLSPTANATGLINIPGWVVPPLGGLPVYVCFAVANASGVVAVSNRALLTIL